MIVFNLKQVWKLPSNQYEEHCSTCPNPLESKKDSGPTTWKPWWNKGFKKLQNGMKNFLVKKPSVTKSRRPRPKRKIRTKKRVTFPTTLATTSTTTTTEATTTTSVPVLTLAPADNFFTFNLPPFQWLTSSFETESKGQSCFNKKR